MQLRESGAAADRERERRVGVAPRARLGSVRVLLLAISQSVRQHGHAPRPHVCPTHRGQGLALLTSRRRGSLDHLVERGV